MDNKKDIQNDTYHHGSQQRKDDNTIDFFSKDETFVYVYKKTEKLATALYMVTNLFSDSEPMKWTLRTKVSYLLSFIIGFKDILQSREDEFSGEVKTRVLEIVSLLEVAVQSGLVSPMNFSILKGEFIHMANFLSSFKKSSSHHMDLKENFFDVPQLSSKHIQSSQTQTQADSIGHNPFIESHKRTNRQNIIIGLLKKKSDISINDITKTITDCSEKTIQRELIALIQAGIVRKTGERRWSKYSLVI